jgi:hypothetical protein
VKQTHDLTRLRVDASQVWSLENITVEAAPRQVLKRRRTMMDFGDDVIDLKRQLIR